jgi:Ca-activated chloride channel family protein
MTVMSVMSAMSVMRLTGIAGLAIVALSIASGAPMLAGGGHGGQDTALRIVSPTEDAILTGVTELRAEISSDVAVRTVTFFVDGRLICTVEAPPFRCTWDAGVVVSGHHVRVVASLANGARLIGNVRTKDVGHSERIKVEAVLVPVIVTDRGKFVRGLKKQDFEVLEDGVAQSVGSLVSEEAPLELVLAIDISGSMEQALPDVKVAVKHLLSKLRPGDAATLIGFNDTTFLVAESETDPQAREEAVDLLTSWGGTALYDATIFSIDLVNRRWGRKGVVIFSDGDDKHSLTRRDAAMARVQASDAMMFTVGFGGAAALPDLRKRLQDYAVSTGGRAFFPHDTKQLDEVFGTIVAELSNQYVLSYSPANPNPIPESKWRTIKVRVPKGRYDIRARQGYRSLGSRAER